jgi:predicted dehydrogenase
MAKEGGPVRVAVVGLGGFAGSHHGAVRELEREGACKLVATCDPRHTELVDAIQTFELRERGVHIYGDLDELLAAHGGALDVVTLPTPIPLHAGQHRAVVRAGAACYLEKPPTLWWPEFQDMLGVEEEAVRSTQVGFNFVGDPMRRALKERILAGEFGALQGATLFGIWPRDRAYYTRNDWAGRLNAMGKPVMDSPTGNAMAHYVQNLLFWCGSPAVESVAIPREVQARLFRAHPIESFDTAFVAATLEGGAWLRIGVTHTGQGGHLERETIHCESAAIVVDSWHSARVEYRDGRVEEVRSPYADHGELLRENLRAYFAYVQGERERPVTGLVDSEGFVALNHVAFLAAGSVEDFPEDRLDRNAETGRVGVAGLEEELLAFVDEGRGPELGVARLNDLPRSTDDSRDTGANS